MALNYSKINFIGSANTFKNTGVFSTSVILPSSCPGSSEVSGSSTIFLNENQDFAGAIAQYTEFTKGGAVKWQPLQGDVDVSTSIGNIAGFMIAKVSGQTVTFSINLRNPTGAAITITPQSIPIKYVTYTLTR